MKKVGFLFILMILLPLALTGQNWTILAEDAAGLWGQADGTGCANDLVKAAFAAAGKPVVLEVMPYIRAKEMVLNREALACFGMAWSEELVGRVVFPQTPLYMTTSTVLVRKAEAKPLKSAKDLKGPLTVGTVVGYEYPPAVTRLIQAGTLVPSEGKSEVQNLKRLASGRIDLVVAQLDDLKTADYLLRQAGVQDEVVVAFEWEGSSTYLGFAAQDPQTPTALQAFDQGMALIKKSGQYKDILATWKNHLLK